MQYIFSALVVLHGAIHLMGFLKAFKLSEIEQLKIAISKFSGILWLFCFLLFLIAGVSYLLKINFWHILAFAGVLLSSVLIFSAWNDAKFGMIPNIIILLVAIVAFASSSFQSKYARDVRAGLADTQSVTESLLTDSDIADLPEPVQKYIRYTGFVGKPKVNSFRIGFTGSIRKNEKSGWMPFSTGQYNFQESSTRLFFMKAVMMHMPVAGYHCFNNGKAFMDIRLFSLIKVQYQAGKEMDISETVTFFNDMCCMAPGTLTDKRIKWLESDSSRVKAAFTNNDITITANLFFNEKGELINFISEDRYAAGEGNGMQRIPWSTPLKDYKDIGGYRLAGNAEAIYSYPEGDLIYGTFNLTDVEYNPTSFTTKKN